MHWYKFFFVTQSEKRGTVLLLFIVSVLLTIRVVLAQYGPEPPHSIEQNSPFLSDSTQSSYRSLNLSKGPSSSTYTRSYKTDGMVELNGADTTLLKQLRGIGSGYARTIVNYRNKLGGFYAKEQLLEVYRFKEETYQKIQHQLQVDTTLIQKIPINEASIDELKRHPYIRYFQAKSLYDNRLKRPGKRYNSVNDVVEDKDVTPAFIQRIAPYLSFQ